MESDGLCFLWLVSGERGRGEWMGVEKTVLLCNLRHPDVEGQGTEQDSEIKPVTVKVFYNDNQLTGLR